MLNERFNSDIPHSQPCGAVYECYSSWEDASPYHALALQDLGGI